MNRYQWSNLKWKLREIMWNNDILNRYEKSTSTFRTGDSNSNDDFDWKFIFNRKPSMSFNLIPFHTKTIQLFLKCFSDMCDDRLQYAFVDPFVLYCSSLCSNSLNIHVRSIFSKRNFQLRYIYTYNIVNFIDGFCELPGHIPFSVEPIGTQFTCQLIHTYPQSNRWKSNLLITALMIENWYEM